MIDAYLAWVELLERLLVCGRGVSPRGRVTTELTGVSIRIENLRHNVIVHSVRDLNYRFMVAEWMWIAMGMSEVEPLLRYNSKMLAYSDDSRHLSGAYGPHVVRQLPYVFETLMADAESRQAVMTIWQPSPAPSKDIPCTVSLQFLLRDDALHLVVNMRSSDAWLGLPYDLFVFSQIGNALAGMLNVRSGSLVVHLGSSHLYAEHLEAAHQLVSKRDNRIGFRPEGYCVVSPQLHHWPPAEFDKIMLGVEVDPLDSYVWDAYRLALTSKTKVGCLEVLRATSNLR